jgi:hypothetical protein
MIADCFVLLRTPRNDGRNGVFLDCRTLAIIETGTWNMQNRIWLGLPNTQNNDEGKLAKKRIYISYVMDASGGGKTRECIYVSHGRTNDEKDSFTAINFKKIEQNTRF